MFCILSIGPHFACDDDLPPPPPTSRPEAIEPPIDLHHTIQFKADRIVSFANVVLVLQADSGGVGVSLTTARPTQDGTSILLAENAQGVGIAKLVEEEIVMRGGKMFTAAGSTVRTTTCVYKPREAIFSITKLSNEEASGTISGEFYRFAAPATAITRPTVVKVEAAFTARVIMR